LRRTQIYRQKQDNVEDQKKDKAKTQAKGKTNLETRQSLLLNKRAQVLFAAKHRSPSSPSGLCERGHGAGEFVLQVLYRCRQLNVFRDEGVQPLLLLGFCVQVIHSTVVCTMDSAGRTWQLAAQLRYETILLSQDLQSREYRIQITCVQTGT